jgi:hypothetical protein
LVSVALLEGAGLLEAKAHGKRVGGLEGLTKVMVKLGVAGARSNDDTWIGRSGAAMCWKIVDVETTFKGGEHHTPKELGKATTRESLPLRWQTDSDGQDVSL